jgi:hypothetical protein
LIRVKRDGESKIFQLHKEQVETLFDQNIGSTRCFSINSMISSVDEAVKKKIRDKKLANESDDLKLNSKKNHLSILMIDGERASAFFAKHVLICEGATKIFLIILLIQLD